MALPTGENTSICKALASHQSANTDAPAQPSQTISTPNTDQPAASHEPFRLLHLPAELRFKIYREAIASGTTNILQTSHFIHQETCALKYKAGIFRIPTQGIGPFSFIPPAPAHFPIPTPIQNIEIGVTIKLGSGAIATIREENDMGCIAAFTDAAAAAVAGAGDVVQRGTCYITFKKNVCMPLHLRPDAMLHTIRKLKGFKRMIVTAIASGCDGDVGAQRAVVRARNKPVYAMALEELEPVFGPGVWHDAVVQEGRYLEFRPRGVDGVSMEDIEKKGGEGKG